MPGAIALLSDSMKKAIVGTLVAGVVRTGGVLEHLIGPLFYSMAAVRLLREK
jgi:hypothetical protein